MSAAGLHAAGESRIEVTGPVVFATAGDLLEASRALFAGSAPLYVDLGGVTRVDSAALALLIEWLRMARQHHRTLRIERVPEKLLAIARLTGVEDIISSSSD